MHGKMNDMLEVLHTKFQHASVNELKRIVKMNANMLEMIKDADVDHWHKEGGQFCSSCVEG
jgi:hypothetical protein